MTPAHPKTKTKKRSRGPKQKELDRLFSLYVRARDQHCQRCGGTSYLQAAHCMSRTYTGTRWDPENVHALCRSCHFWETNRPIEGEIFWREFLGDHLYESLRRKALLGGKGIDRKALASWLRGELRRMGVEH